MQTRTSQLVAHTAGLLATLLLMLLGPLAPAGAQGTLSLSFETPYFVVQTTSDSTSRVPYGENIRLSPAGATVACTPPLGSIFQRGATKVTCTAELGSQRQQGSFYVLVAKNDARNPDNSDTDVELGPITVDINPIEPAGFVTYNVEYRATVPTAARKVELTTTLPAQARFVEISDGNCDTTRLPTITCVLFNVSAPDSLQLEIQARPGFVGSYAISWSLRLLPNDDGTLQRELLAENNRASIQTVVRVAQAPNRLFMPMLVKQ